GHGVDEFGAHVVQGRPVVSGVPGRQDPVAHQLQVAVPAWLVGGVVVHAVAVRQEPEPVGHGIEPVGGRVGRAAQVPADAAGTGAAEYHAGLPAFAQDL